MKKIISIAVICALGAMLLASCDKKTSSEPQPKGITKSDIDSVSYMVGYSTGMQIAQSGFGALSTNAIIKGIMDATKGVEIDYMYFQNVINGFMEKRSAAISGENKAESEKLFAANAKNPDVKVTESGLQYQIVKPGSDVKPGPQDTVEVNYEGKNLKGKVFDSSYERGQAARFPLDGVIKGWTEGLQLIGEGGEIMLWIPAELAYGDRNVGSDIGPDEALTFKVELISVSPKVEVPEPEEKK
ncbi:MAG: FKBP-type peptidyl-prolyl cis-trans isomerase [Bacteroidales bacterium]|nr:FKBP-type peptidyl-prolyl cis-trans isomerase [Bacteroidales bacterium]